MKALSPKINASTHTHASSTHNTPHTHMHTHTQLSLSSILQVDLSCRYLTVLFCCLLPIHHAFLLPLPFSSAPLSVHLSVTIPFHPSSHLPFTPTFYFLPSSQTVLPAIDAYLSAAQVTATSLSNITDLSTVPFRSGSSQTIIPLPLIPDVSVQYRCGDNVGFGKHKYGVRF
jgi:hypothetical protein